MPVRMKALKSFRGQPGEGEGGRVKAGREFDAVDERRAQELEKPPHKVPLAVRVGVAKVSAAAPVEPPPRAAPAARVPMSDPKAADKLIEKNTPGPLFLTGGAIGAEPSPSSSAPGRRQQRSGLSKSEDKPAS